MRMSARTQGGPAYGLTRVCALAPPGRAVGQHQGLISSWRELQGLLGRDGWHGEASDPYSTVRS